VNLWRLAVWFPSRLFRVWNVRDGRGKKGTRSGVKKLTVSRTCIQNMRRQKKHVFDKFHAWISVVFLIQIYGIWFWEIGLISKLWLFTKIQNKPNWAAGAVVVVGLGMSVESKYPTRSVSTMDSTENNPAIWMALERCKSCRWERVSFQRALNAPKKRFNVQFTDNMKPCIKCA
jgi:hypothetical protein